MGLILDFVFLITLFALLPIYTIYRQRKFEKSRQKDTRTQKGFTALHRTSLVALLLLGALGAAWVSNGRGLSDLGLGVPGNRGLVSLAIIALVPLALAVVAKLKPSEGAEIDAEDSILVPTSKEEFLRQIPFVIFISAAWEIIYRGALMFYFTPYLGVIMSMVAAAAFYTFQHRAKNPKQYIETFLMAFFFLGLFVVSGSLWGPIVLHCMFPVIGGFAVLRYQEKST